MLTSIREGLPNVIMEAMVAGLPVAAYRVGGVEELIEDGRSGRLVPCGDEKALFTAVCDLLQDTGRSQSMGRTGRRRMLEHFSAEKTVAETAALYQEVLGKRPVDGKF